jgi:phage terminase large subunit
MGRLINKNLKYIYSAWRNQQYSPEGNLLFGKRGVVLEGSSRSGKTWSIIDFIILICTRYETNCTINIIRETYNEFKTTLYDDFGRRLDMFGLYNPFSYKQDIASFKIFGNKINFIGADKPSKFHGAQCDYFWINEALPVSKAIFDQQEMRCSKFWIMDYNPSVTEHWIFNSTIPRPDVGWCQTTFLDNPWCPIAERNKILSYDPSNPKNIEAGTADDFMWKVYGLGLRGAAQGLIFKNVTWIDKFPDGIRFEYGVDFGWTNDPFALVKVGISSHGLFAELKCYEPIDNTSSMTDVMKGMGVKWYDIITADDADKFNDVEAIKELRLLGWKKIQKVHKGKGINWRIGLMKQSKIHIVRNINAKREQENYKWREINGILTNEPIDKFNHFWDAFGYGFLGMLKEKPRGIKVHN